MTKEQAKALIQDAVTSLQGCKVTELIAHESLQPLYMAKLSPTDLIYELIEEGRLVEVEYSVPALDFRAKSFVLPAGSIVKLRRGP